jgi:hypothetical protein
VLYGPRSGPCNQYCDSVSERVITEATVDVDRGEGQNQAPAPHPGFLEKEIELSEKRKSVW